MYDELLKENPVDEANVVILNNTLKQVIHLQNIALRSTETVILSIPDSWQSFEIHAWLYFSTANNNRFSDSKFLGLLTV